VYPRTYTPEPVPRLIEPRLYEPRRAMGDAGVRPGRREIERDGDRARRKVEIAGERHGGGRTRNGRELRALRCGAAPITLRGESSRS
jgi:hypothetical protein